MGVNYDAEDVGANHNHRSPSAKAPRAPQKNPCTSAVGTKNGDVGMCCGTNRGAVVQIIN
jgi:hypothetical protein